MQQQQPGSSLEGPFGAALDLSRGSLTDSAHEHAGSNPFVDNTLDSSAHAGSNPFLDESSGNAQAGSNPFVDTPDSSNPFLADTAAGYGGSSDLIQAEARNGGDAHGMGVSLPEQQDGSEAASGEADGSEATGGDAELADSASWQGSEGAGEGSCGAGNGPGDGHLVIAGRYSSGAETLSVSAAPSPARPQPPAGMHVYSP
jgi:hypothetical protein